MPYIDPTSLRIPGPGEGTVQVLEAPKYWSRYWYGESKTIKRMVFKGPESGNFLYFSRSKYSRTGLLGYWYGEFFFGFLHPPSLLPPSSQSQTPAHQVQRRASPACETDESQSPKKHNGMVNRPKGEGKHYWHLYRPIDIVRGPTICCSWSFHSEALLIRIYTLHHHQVIPIFF